MKTELPEPDVRLIELPTGDHAQHKTYVFPWDVFSIEATTDPTRCTVRVAHGHQATAFVCNLPAPAVAERVWNAWCRISAAAFLTRIGRSAMDELIRAVGAMAIDRLQGELSQYLDDALGPKVIAILREYTQEDQPGLQEAEQTRKDVKRRAPSKKQEV